MVKLRATRNMDATQARCELPPFPSGWWAVELSRNLKAGKLIERMWMGRRVVAWRDHQNHVCVADAHCPHMGASLSPSAGGTVQFGKLKCPFHGFEYDTSGKCVETPNAPPPKSCQLNTYPVCECMGFVFAYWGSAGQKPQWELPMLEEEGWTKPKVSRFVVRSHPQDIAENSVDMNHLQNVHEWKDGEQTLRPVVEGQHYMAALKYTGSLRIARMTVYRYETEPIVHLWGLGFMYSDAEDKTRNMIVRTWFLPIPLDGDYFETILAIQARKKDVITRAKLLDLVRDCLHWMETKLAVRLISLETNTQFKRDISIWNHRRYLSKPSLCSSDGDVYKFRQYCKQFY